MSAVITGVGVIAPNGRDTESFWAATLKGVSGLGPIERFDASSYPVRVAGEVSDFDPAGLSARLLPQTDHMTRMALVASDRALEDAGIDTASIPEFSMGVVTASASGGFEFGQRELQKLWSQGSQYVSAYQSFAWFYAVNSGQISIRHGLRGPSGVLVAEQAGGIDAIAQARRQIRNGTPFMITGGVDSALCPWGLTAQIPNGQLSSERDPCRAYRPFDVDASGHVPGEGGALLVLEDAAMNRSGPYYGEIAGWGATFDATEHSAGPDGLIRAIDHALTDAGVVAADVDLVLADASGVPGQDRIEAAALRAVFGTRGVPVSAPKSMTGRLYSGGAALDVAVAALALRDQIIPPTVGTAVVPDDDGLDLVLDVPRDARLRVVLILARGHGGFNSALVVRGPH